MTKAAAVTKASAKRPVFNQGKMSELIVYVANKVGETAPLGMMKLNKVLMYADMQAYISLGEPITGATYIRKPLGPVAREMLSVKKELEANKAIVIVPHQQVGRDPINRIMPGRDADLRAFSPAEIALVDRVIDDVRGLSGRFLSRLSHRHAFWVLAEADGEIPYEAAFLRDCLADETDIARGIDLAREHGWFTKAAS